MTQYIVSKTPLLHKPFAPYIKLMPSPSGSWLICYYSQERLCIHLILWCRALLCWLYESLQFYSIGRQLVSGYQERDGMVDRTQLTSSPLMIPSALDGSSLPVSTACFNCGLPGERIVKLSSWRWLLGTYCCCWSCLFWWQRANNTGTNRTRNANAMLITIHAHRIIPSRIPSRIRMSCNLKERVLKYWSLKMYRVHSQWASILKEPRDRLRCVGVLLLV